MSFPSSSSLFAKIRHICFDPARVHATGSPHFSYFSHRNTLAAGPAPLASFLHAGLSWPPDCPAPSTTSCQTNSLSPFACRIRAKHGRRMAQPLLAAASPPYPPLHAGLAPMGRRVVLLLFFQVLATGWHPLWPPVHPHSPLSLARQTKE